MAQQKTKKPLSIEQFKEILDAVGDGVSVQDMHYMILYQNNSHKKLVGDHVGEFCYEAFEKSSQVCEGCPLKLSFKDGQTHTAERSTTTDGRILYVEVTASLLRDDAGHIIAGVEIARDVTARKNAEAAMQQRESALSAIIENQPGLVWLKDRVGRFLAVNHSFVLSCGKKRSDEVVARTDLDIWPLELAEKYRRDDQLVMEKAASYTVEELVYDRGELRWFETFKAPVLSSQGVVIGTTGYARDITERKLAENALQKAHDQLERKVLERTAELEQKTLHLEESNIALKVLMKQQEEVKKELEKNILFNVNELVKPSLEKLKNNTSDKHQKVYLKVIESNLNEIVSSFFPGLTKNFSKLTPAEIHIANLIRQGKTTKEIAGLLRLSPSTIAGHRQNIRKKFDLTNKKLNLQTTLKTDQ